MRTDAGIARPIGRPGTLCWAVLILVCALLGACGTGPGAPPREILAEHCIRVGGQLPSSLSIESPSDGLLRVRIEERGLTVVAALEGVSGSESESPVERLGTLQLVTATTAGQTHT